MRASDELVEDPRDLLRRMPVSEGLGLRARGVELLDRVEDVLRLRPDERVPAVLDRLDPLRLVPQGDARDAEEVRLLLDAAGIREDLRRPHQQRDEVEVVDRLDGLYAGAERFPQPERFQVLPRPRMDREHDRPTRAAERADDALEYLPVVHVARS